MAEKRRRNMARTKTVSIAADTDARTYRVYVEEEGDPTVGIPPAYGSVAIIIPDWLIPSDQGEEFEEALAIFIKSWADGGIVQTQAEKNVSDEGEVLRERAAARSEVASDKAERRYW